MRSRNVVSMGLAAGLACVALACSDDAGTSDGGGGASAPSGTTGTGFEATGSSTSGSGGACGVNLTGTVRDFRAYEGGVGHPDFETFTGNGLDGIVLSDLGADHKPVYASSGPTQYTTGPAEFTV